MRITLLHRKISYSDFITITFNENYNTFLWLLLQITFWCNECLYKGVFFSQLSIPIGNCSIFLSLAFFHEKKENVNFYYPFFCASGYSFQLNIKDNCVTAHCHGDIKSNVQTKPYKHKFDKSDIKQSFWKECRQWSETFHYEQVISYIYIFLAWKTFARSSLNASITFYLWPIHLVSLLNV